MRIVGTADASIAVWDCKRTYDSVRPITALRFLKEGKQIRAWAGPNKGVRIIPGEQWLPYQPATFLTPPFAEYVSGHSSYSAAGAAALAGFFCADAIPFSHATDSAPGGTPRDYAGFAAASAEAGRSRVYGGQHFEFSNQAGLEIGRGVSAEVFGTRLLRTTGPTHFGACPR